MSIGRTMMNRVSAWGCDWAFPDQSVLLTVRLTDQTPGMELLP